MKATRLGVLLHSLGLGRRAGTEPYRNHFVAGPGHDDYETCRHLVAEGLMEERPASEITQGDHRSIEAHICSLEAAIQKAEA
jgi:hypothetical protein